ncbi:MAG: PQQ-binding-like beta-propeller repeat protein, partial [Deltaproteobacteria bacterium]|nr:PQQ-binding-like beta-propeller repeat protein [Deltaproteobacteria bacterium]
MKRIILLPTALIALLILCAASLCGAEGGELVWKFDDALGYPIVASPTVSNGFAYIGSRNGTLYCLDAANGKQEWYWPTENAIVAPCAVSDTYAYVGSNDNKIYCLKTANGALQWSYATDGPIIAGPVLVDDIVFVGSIDDRLYCLDATPSSSSGEKKWDYATGGDISATPVISGGYVYFGSEDGKLYSFTAETVYSTTQFTFASAITTSPAIEDDNIYVVTDPGALQCITKLTSGDQTLTNIWGITTGYIITTGPVVSNGLLYFGTHDGTIVCYESATRAKKWTFQTGGSVRSRPAVNNGYLYAGSDDHKLYCLNADNGTEIWSYDSGSSMKSGPAVSQGLVYFGNDLGIVFALTAAADLNDTELPLSVPTVRITAPADNATFSAGVAVSFNGTAVDSSNTILSGEALVWSSDRDGRIGTGETVTCDDLSPGSHTVTLTATDTQALSSSADINIFIDNATVVNASPVVTISAPADNATFARTASIVFSGTAVSADNERLIGEALVWLSSLDGELGTGQSILRSALTEGIHVITLTATDPTGASGADTITLNITATDDDNDNRRCLAARLLGNDNPRLMYLRTVRDSVLTQTTAGR